jgi:hypothetical protein
MANFHQLDKHSGDGRGHPTDEAAADHGFEGDGGEVFFAVGGHGGEAADLDTDADEVGEIGDGVSGEDGGALTEIAEGAGDGGGGGLRGGGFCGGEGLGSHVFQLFEGDEFVGGDFQADDATDFLAFGPVGDADEPGDGAEDPAEDAAEIEGLGELHGFPDRGERPVDEGDDGGEGDEHGDDVEVEEEAVAGAVGGRFEDVVGAAVDGEGEVGAGFGGFGFGADEFGHDEGTGGAEDFGGEDVGAVDVDAAEGGAVHQAGVDGDHSGGHGGETAGHEGLDFGFGHAREILLDGEAGFGLADEDLRGHLHGFRAADAHGDGHAFGEEPDDDLHDAEVVKDGHEGGEEDDGAEAGGGEGEDEAVGFGGVGERAEDKVGAGGGHAHEFDDEVGELLEYPDALGGAEYEEGEEELDGEADENGSPGDAAFVGGKEPRKEAEGEDADYRAHNGHEQASSGNGG